jgi:drug/metabolite transporter (DMT)-like permease
MTSLRTLDMFGLAALAVGVVLAILSHRVPKRGWIGVVLLIVASLAWAFIDAGDSAQPSRLPMFLAFLLVAPVAVVYSFRARRSAPDRVPALAAFVGSFVVAAFLLFMVGGIVYSLFVI